MTGSYAGLVTTAKDSQTTIYRENKDSVLPA